MNDETLASTKTNRHKQINDRNRNDKSNNEKGRGLWAMLYGPKKSWDQKQQKESRPGR